MPDAKSDKSVREWMGILKGLYFDKDSQKSPEDVWFAAVGHCNTIGESIRTTILKKDLLTAAAHAFCWICSFINRCHPSLEKDSVFTFDGCLSGVIALKYPNECGHCLKKPCNCNATEIDKVPDKAAHYEKLLQDRNVFKYEGFTVAKWQETFTQIFGNNVHQMTLESIGLHFLEEVGEVVTAVRGLKDLRGILRREIDGLDTAFLNRLTTVEGIVETYVSLKRQLPDGEKKEFKQRCFTRDEPLIWKWRLVVAKTALVIEIADTFSWFCSVLNKIQQISNDNEMGLPPLEQRLTEEYFKDGSPSCPTCRNSKCLCLFCP